MVRDASAFAASEGSDALTCWEAWAVWARAGKIETDVNSASPAIAGAASAVVRQKGFRRLINARSSILLSWAEMSGVDQKCRQRPAKAIVDTLGKLDPVVGAEQVEVSRVVPLMHDGKP